MWMTESKNTSKTEPRKPTAKRSKVRAESPTPAELALAARQLKGKLDWIVEQLDSVNAKGKTDAEAWNWIHWAERKPNRKSLDQTPGVIQAITVFCERSVVDFRRLLRACVLSTLALEHVRGRIRAEHAIRDAARARQDDHLTASGTIEELRSKVSAARNERSKWQAAYCVLAWDGDVWPRPETARARSSALARLYRESVSELKTREINRRNLRQRNEVTVAHTEPEAARMGA